MGAYLYFLIIFHCLQFCNIEKLYHYTTYVNNDEPFNFQIYFESADIYLGCCGLLTILCLHFSIANFSYILFLLR